MRCWSHDMAVSIQLVDCAYHNKRTNGYLPLTAYCLPLTAYYRLNRLLPLEPVTTADRLNRLPLTAYRFPLTAYRLLPLEPLTTAYRLLPLEPLTTA